MESARLARDRVHESDGLGQQAQGFTKVFGLTRLATHHRVELVARNGQSQSVHVHPQLVAAAGLGEEFDEPLLYYLDQQTPGGFVVLHFEEPRESSSPFKSYVTVMEAR